MDNIAGETKNRRGLSAVFSAVGEVLPKVSLKKTAIALCPFGAVLATGAVLLNMKHVKIITPDKTANLTTFKTNITDILKDDGINTSKNDEIIFSGFKNNNATIRVIPAFKVSVAADGKITTVMTAGGNVGDVLAKTGIKLGKEDMVNVSVNAKVKSGEVITVKRVTYETKVHTEPLAYKTETLKSVVYEKGVSKIVEEGSEGQKSVVTKVKLVDGKAIGETKVSEKIKKEPVCRKIVVGTASSSPSSKLVPPKSLKLDSNGVPTNYSQCIKGKATAYYSAMGTRTSTGRHVKVGYVAVDPKLIPYGSKLYIMSTDGSYVYGYAIAADTGEFVHNGSGVLTDLYLSSQKECRNFGVKRVAIYVLN